MPTSPTTTSPTKYPTKSPTNAPTPASATPSPTKYPTKYPTKAPTSSPTDVGSGDRYHLSLNTFTYQYAEQYCQSHCNSHLASVHSNASYQNIIHLINHFGVNSLSFWLGLEQTAPNTFSWIDGTQFDFGNDTASIGNFPWRGSEPDADQYLTLFGGSNLQWRMVAGSASNMPICNSCDGKLTKYIILDDNTNKLDYQATDNKCKLDYNTGIASIHSNNDTKEASTLCSITNNQNSDFDTCLFGLMYNNNNGFTYSFSDGTEIDYPMNITKQSMYPWCNNEPSFLGNVGNICVNILGMCWEGVSCSVSKYGICNMKSEICFQSEWNLVSGNAWTFTQSPCAVSNSYSDGINVAILDNKRFDNNDKPLIIEFMYSMSNISSYSDGGIILLLNTPCNRYYYIGISTDSKIFLAEITNHFDYNIIAEQLLDFTYQTSTFYSLRVEIENGVYFNIFVNNINYISNYYSNLFDNIDNTLSGYIGIRNINSSLIAKSLFVSGSIVWNKISLTLPIFNLCTSEPTDYPSNNPSKQPTFNPTLTPSNSPFTAPPTMTPITINPTLSPVTVNPTLSPVTVNPTVSPNTVNPTTTVTMNPTKMLTTSDESNDVDSLEIVTGESFADNKVFIYAIIIGGICCIVACTKQCMDINGGQICRKDKKNQNKEESNHIEMQKSINNQSTAHNIDIEDEDDDMDVLNEIEQEYGTKGGDYHYD
eukprot:304418_1